MPEIEPTNDPNHGELDQSDWIDLHLWLEQWLAQFKPKPKRWPLQRQKKKPEA